MSSIVSSYALKLFMGKLKYYESAIYDEIYFNIFSHLVCPINDPNYTEIIKFLYYQGRDKVSIEVLCDLLLELLETYRTYFLSIIRDNSIEELFSTKYIIDLSDERLSDNYFDWFWFYWNQNKDNSLSINFTNSFYYIEFVINWYIYYQIRKDHWEKIDDIDIFCNHKSFPDVITDYFEKKYYKLVGIYILLHKNFLDLHSYLPFHIVDFDK